MTPQPATLKPSLRLDQATHRFLTLQRPSYGSLSLAESAARLEEEIGRFATIIRPFLPAPNERRGVRVIDVGCGIGTSLVALWRHFGAKARYVALDKTGTAEQIYYGFEKDAAAYNDLALTTKFLTESGIPLGRLSTVDVDEAGYPRGLGPFDVVISTISWGFHYPVDTYLSDVLATTKPGALLYLDLRLGQGGEEQLAPHFELLWSASGRKQLSGVWRRR